MFVYTLVEVGLNWFNGLFDISLSLLETSSKVFMVKLVANKQKPLRLFYINPRTILRYQFTTPQANE